MVGLVTGLVCFLQKNALAETDKVLQAKVVELQDGERVARRRDAARENLERDRTQLQFLETAVTDAEYVPSLLAQVERLAKATHNKVLGVRPQTQTAGPSRIEQRRDPDAQSKTTGVAEGDKAPTPEPYTPLAIQVNLVGSYQSAQSFVDRLMRFPKIIAVEEVQIRPHRQNASVYNSSALLDVELKITAYVMKPEATPRHRVASAAGTGGIN